MIVGDELRAWAADRPKQRATAAAVEALGQAWAQGPIHRHFIDLADRFAPGGAETLAEAVEAVFADDAWVGAFIDTLVAALRVDPYFEPPFRAISSDVHSGLLVYDDGRLQIAVGVSKAAQLAAKKSGHRGPTSIGFSGQMSVLKFLRAGGARLSFWEAPAITGDFSAASAGLCVRTGAREIADGDILAIDGRCRSYVVEHARANLLILQAMVLIDGAPVSTEYDSATGAYVGCSATGDAASRVQMLTTLLRKLDHQEAFPVLARYLDDPDFFVRWHVMREMLGLDAVAALPHLRRMASCDPHPDPRRAASSVLPRVEAAATRRAA